MSRHIKRHPVMTSLVLVGVLIAGIVFSVTMHFGSSSAYADEPNPALSSSELEVILMRAGLDAQSLCAAGVSSEQASECVDDTIAHLDGALVSFRAADEGLASARSNYRSLRHLSQAGVATEQQLIDLATAQSALTSAQQAMDVQFSALITAATADLSNDQRTRLTNLRTAGDWAASCAFKVAARTDAQWAEIRDALANERICAERSESPDQSLQTCLSSVREESAVIAASAALSTALTGVSDQWQSAVNAVDQQ